MRRLRNAKIIATLGPASSSEAAIRDLFVAGADVFRLNFSHGILEEHRARLEIIRRLEKQTGRPVAALLDLQGPKLRIGRFKPGSARLREGSTFRLDLDEAPGDERRAPLPHREVFAALRPGVELLLDDGRIRLVVKTSGANFAETLVKVGGSLSSNKGVNVPDVVLPLSPFTDKDERDLRAGLELGIDWVAPSFIQRPQDVLELRRRLDGRAAIMVKLEKPAAVERLEEIVDLADAVMVARGDLGVELPPERVPSVQKSIVRECRAAGRPVVVATQMLESMIEAPVPTRAEASDVASAVYDGVDAVMLSGETAVGKIPGGGRSHHGPHHSSRGARSPLPPGHGRGPPRSPGHHRGCDLRGHPPDRRDHAGGCDRDLHQLGIQRPARGTGTPQGADPQPHAQSVHRAPPLCRVGSARPAERRSPPGAADGR